MSSSGNKPWRGLPISEATFAVALIIAVIGLLSVGTPRGDWAMAGALILGLLAGFEIRWRERQARKRDARSQK